jgi:hypothetical protein
VSQKVELKQQVKSELQDSFMKTSVVIKSDSWLKHLEFQEITMGNSQQDIDGLLDL